MNVEMAQMRNTLDLVMLQACPIFYFSILFNSTRLPVTDIDAVELEVFKHLFASVSEEMGARLMRSAYSPNIKERLDFSCALFDAEGEMIAQAAHIPVHLGSTPMSVQAVLRSFPASEMKSGDRFILNDPFRGGTHLPDITLVAPCIPSNEAGPRFFAANRAHHADVGGISPGSMPMSTSIDDEGIRIPPTRIDTGTLEKIAAASRTPEERFGDLRAQTAALRLGVQRLVNLCSRYGTDAVAARAKALQQYTARIMAGIVENIPDGSYFFRDLLDDDGFGATDIEVACRLTIAGSKATVDFSASGDQVLGPVNAVRAITQSAVNYVFRCLAPSDLPSNSGVMAPIEVITRSGSVVDAMPPAAVAAGNVETSQRIVDVLLGALAQALPERIPAASSGTMSNLTVGGTDPRTERAFAYYETLAGGAGAGPHTSGAGAVHTHMTNTLNTPVEALEHAYPFRIGRYAIRDGSGGHGMHRGGDGIIRRYMFTVPAEVTLLTERRRNAPFGLHGGESGAPGANILERGGVRTALPSKCSFQVEDGDVVEIQTPGGGGWGTKDGGGG